MSILAPQNSASAHQEPPRGRDDPGVWDLIELAKRPGDAGAAARDFAGALEELRQATTAFSIGAARSAVSVGVIGTQVDRLQVELEDLASRMDSLRASSERSVELGQRVRWHGVGAGR